MTHNRAAVQRARVANVAARVADANRDAHRRHDDDANRDARRRSGPPGRTLWYGATRTRTSRSEPLGARPWGDSRELWDKGTKTKRGKYIGGEGGGGEQGKKGRDT